MDEFQQYIEDKYMGREVISSKNEELTVRTIADLNFNNLEPIDQQEALANDWAWGLYEDIRGKTVCHGILFRPTQRDFLLSGERFNCLVGGLGTGKTFSLGLKITMMMFSHPGMHFLIYRKTVSQLLGTTVKQLLEDVFPTLGLKEGLHWKHHASPVKRYISVFIGDVEGKIYYRPYKDQGVSHDTMVDDIKSFNIDSIGIDEPPTLGLDTYRMIEGRIGRWDKSGKSPVPKKLQQLNVVGNPPDEHHWLNLIYGKGVEPKNPDKELKNKHRYKMWYMSSYENRDAIAAEYIEWMESNPEEWQRTFLHGLPGYVEHSGTPIYTASFNDERHVARGDLPFDPNQPLVLGWDISGTGVDKACLIAQLDKDACLLCLEEVISNTPGLPDFVNRVKQRIATRWRTNVELIHSYADPAAWVEEQISLMTPATLLAKSGFPSQKGAKNLPARFTAVTNLLTQDGNNGKPGILISYERCPTLRTGFTGGYRYKDIDEGERVVSALPIKNIYSHIHDALQYAATGIMRVFESGVKPMHNTRNPRQPTFALPTDPPPAPTGTRRLPKRLRPGDQRHYHSPLSRYPRSRSSGRRF